MIYRHCLFTTLSVILCLVLLLFFTSSANSVEPLAPRVRRRTQSSRLRPSRICVGSPDILSLPSGRLIASMELWLKRPTSSDEGGIDYPNHCKVKASDDGGETWSQISTNGITWGHYSM